MPGQKKSKAEEFGKRMAKACLNNPSSHAFFFVQQAYKGRRWGKYGEMMTWDIVKQLLKEVIDE